MEITLKNNQFINNVNININHPGSNSVGKAVKGNDEKKQKTKANRKKEGQTHMQLHWQAYRKETKRSNANKQSLDVSKMSL